MLSKTIASNARPAMRPTYFADEVTKGATKVMSLMTASYTRVKSPQLSVEQFRETPEMLRLLPASVPLKNVDPLTIGVMLVVEQSMLFPNE
jgi:hypothetical protein